MRNRLLKVLGLTLMPLAMATWGQSEENRTIQELPKRVVTDLAKRDLDSIENVLRLKPQDTDALWMRVRLLHALSVQDETQIAEGLATLERFHLPGNPEETRLLAKAYRGAFQVVVAKHAFWPNQKMDALKLGLPDLDSSVNRLPQQMEIRYLRLVSCYYLPFFLGRNWSVREDLQALAKGLPGFREQIPHRWFLGISEFVLKRAEMDRETQKELALAYWSVYDRLHSNSSHSEKSSKPSEDEG